MLWIYTYNHIYIYICNWSKYFGWIYENYVQELHVSKNKGEEEKQSPYCPHYYLRLSVRDRRLDDTIFLI